MYDLLILGSNSFSATTTALRYKNVGLKVKTMTVDNMKYIDGLRFKNFILADGTYINREVLNAIALLESINAKYY